MALRMLRRVIDTDRLIKKVKNRFGFDIPKRVPLEEEENTAYLLIGRIIIPVFNALFLFLNLFAFLL